MTTPLLLDSDFADIRALSEAGLRHTARLWTTVVTRWPNGEETTALVLGDEVSCRLHPASTSLAQRAAAQGVRVQWSLVVALGVDVIIGQQVVVTGETAGAAWSRTVEITADLGLTGRIHRQTTAIDVELNQ